MNERIDELWQEAVDATWTDNSKSAHEKFAELIVRECVDYVFGDEYERKQMLKHFGIEE